MCAPPAFAFSALAAALMAFVLTAASATAAPPPLRDQVSLAGEWPVGGTVPLYGGTPTPADRLTYARPVDVPAAWSGRRIQLEFNAVNFAADIFVDDRLVASHVGAWNPFAVDLTEHVRPGGQFQLRVEVEGMRGPRTVGDDGWERWPVGTPALDGRWTGIADDVWLRAYGEVSIRDAFIQAQVSQGRLRIAYTLRSDAAEPRTFWLRSEVAPFSDAASGSPRTWPALPISLVPGEARIVTVDLPFADAPRWTPDEPFLHVLTSTLVDEAGKTLDRESRRFGYREFAVAGDRFSLNGVPTTLRGDYIGFGAYIPVELQTPAALAGTYRRFKAELNANALRWHLRPPPAHAHEIADETGIFIVAESAAYGRPDERLHMPAPVKAEYLANLHRWLEAWVVSRRNHPSIVLWSVINEMGPKYRNHQGLTVEELKTAGAVVRSLDPTRPLIYHGNAEVRDEDTVSYHYPTLAPETADGDIYQWRRLLVPGKPTGVGEYFQTSPTARPLGPDLATRTLRATEARDWMGHFTRGLRHLGFADLRPKLLNWTIHEPPDSWRVRVVRDTFAPVALFDLDYDALGVAPVRDARLPAVVAGSRHWRRLRLYNEEWSGDWLDYTLSLRLDGAEYERRSGRRQLAPGTSVDWSMELPAPTSPGLWEVVREVTKNGVIRFREVSAFSVTAAP